MRSPSMFFLSSNWQHYIYIYSLYRNGLFALGVDLPRTCANSVTPPPDCPEKAQGRRGSRNQATCGTRTSTTHDLPRLQRVYLTFVASGTYLLVAACVYFQSLRKACMHRIARVGVIGLIYCDDSQEFGYSYQC
ncbi:hypothetical protein L208DRAFT_70294 [Tricholoma matsutake]|nr:hypothetical protein L208DRAFT_70294 [Tricholoma matsutake 945]